MIIYKILSCAVLASGSTVTAYFLDIPAMVGKKFEKTQNLSDSLNNADSYPTKEQKEEIESAITKTKEKINTQDAKIAESNSKIAHFFDQAQLLNVGGTTISSVSELISSINKNNVKVAQIKNNIKNLEKTLATASVFSAFATRLSIWKSQTEETLISRAITKKTEIKAQIQTQTDELKKQEAQRTSLIHNLATQGDLLE